MQVNRRTIAELLASGERLFSFEFFPPKTDDGERQLWQSIRELESLRPAFVSVTYGAGGSTRDKTLEIVSRVRDEFGIEAMAHFTCVGATVEQLREQLDAMREAGLENVLALLPMEARLDVESQRFAVLFSLCDSHRHGCLGTELAAVQVAQALLFTLSLEGPVRCKPRRRFSLHRQECLCY